MTPPSTDLDGGRIPHAVLWDMDGTLLDSEGVWEVALEELMARLGGSMTDAIRRDLIGASSTDTMEILFAALRLEPTAQAVADANEWLQTRVAGVLGQGIPTRPGALEGLRMVRASGLKSALITNTERSLAEYGLDTLGRGFFDVSVCGDEVDEGKPAPDVYLRGAELLGVRASECVAIEDSATGAAAAHAAGCGLIVVPSSAQIALADGWVRRDSLTGLSVTDLVYALRKRSSAVVAAD